MEILEVLSSSEATIRGVAMIRYLCVLRKLHVKMKLELPQILLILVLWLSLASSSMGLTILTYFIYGWYYTFKGIELEQK